VNEEAIGVTLLFVLQPVARADFDDLDAGGQGHGGVSIEMA